MANANDLTETLKAFRVRAVMILVALQDRAADFQSLFVLTELAQPGRDHRQQPDRRPFVVADQSIDLDGQLGLADPFVAAGEIEPRAVIEWLEETGGFQGGDRVFVFSEVMAGDSQPTARCHAKAGR